MSQGNRRTLADHLEDSLFFVCPKHQCLLAELCPECSAPQRSFITASLIPRPGRCWAPVGEGDRRLIGSRCAADLADAQVHYLAEDHPAIATQSTISQAILENRYDFGIYRQLRAPLQEILADLRALGGWFLSQAGRSGMGALIPGGLAAACFEQGEAVRMPVSYMLASASPAANTAAALTAAMAILSRPDVDSAAQLLASVLGNTSKAPLADRINRRGQRPACETSDGLRAVLIAASDRQLRNTSQPAQKHPAHSRCHSDDLSRRDWVSTDGRGGARPVRASFAARK